MSLRTEVKQNIDKVADSTAFQVAAGAGDLAAEKFRQVQDKLATMDVQATLAEMPQRLAVVGEKAQTRLAAVPEKLAALRTEPKAVQEAVQATARQLPERAQDLAVQFAGLAIQAYGELAERGRAVVDRLRSAEEPTPARTASPVAAMAAAEVVTGTGVKPAPRAAKKPAASEPKTVTTARKNTAPKAAKKA